MLPVHLQNSVEHQMLKCDSYASIYKTKKRLDDDSVGNDHDSKQCL